MYFVNCCCCFFLSSYSEHHVLLVFSLGIHLALLQSHSQPTKDPTFTTHLLELCPPILCDCHVSSTTARGIFLGLEHLVLSFSLSSTDKAVINALATDRSSNIVLAVLGIHMYIHTYSHNTYQLLLSSLMGIKVHVLT